jgi:hypothetical protein
MYFDHTHGSHVKILEDFLIVLQVIISPVALLTIPIFQQNFVYLILSLRAREIKVGGANTFKRYHPIALHIVQQTELLHAY